MYVSELVTISFPISCKYQAQGLKARIALLRIKINMCSNCAVRQRRVIDTSDNWSGVIFGIFLHAHLIRVSTAASLGGFD